MANGGSGGELLRLLQTVSGTAEADASAEAVPLPGAGLREINSHLEQLRGVFQTQVASTRENTEALLANSVAQTSRGSELADAGKAATNFLSRGLFLSPLITGLVRLFGGEREEIAPAPLTRFALPPPVQFQGGVSEETGRAIFPVDFGAGDRPRRVVETPAAVPVTIQVQAMDSRSFLDHREEIAAAVREAMLHSHALNDVVADL